MSLQETMYCLYYLNLKLVIIQHKNILIALINYYFQLSKSIRKDYSFIGVTSSTTKSDLAISVLESFAFRIKKILDNYHNEMPQMVLNTLW